MECKLLMGVATHGFTYGEETTLNIVELTNDDDHNNKLSTANLDNKTLDGIELNHYESTNQILIRIPYYMAHEYNCGCSKCHPNKSGHAGDRFLIIALPENRLGQDFVIIGKL